MSVRQRLLQDRGATGGLEIIPFGFLIFVLGAVMMINSWTVIDSWMAVSAAAREGARTYVESDPATAWPQAQAAVQGVMDDYGRGTRALPAARSSTDYNRCQVVTVTASYDIALINAPFIGSFGSFTTIDSSHSERIDPFRSGDFGGSC